MKCWDLVSLLNTRIKQCRWVLEMENEEWGHYDETDWSSSGSLRPDRH